MKKSKEAIFWAIVIFFYLGIYATYVFISENDSWPHRIMYGIPVAFVPSAIIAGLLYIYWARI